MGQLYAILMAVLLVASYISYRYYREKEMACVKCLEQDSCAYLAQDAGELYDAVTLQHDALWNAKMDLGSDGMHAGEAEAESETCHQTH